MKINLGCGHQKKEGFIGVDMRPPADVICLLGHEALPFEDSSVEEIHADNVMEHLDNDEFLQALNECHRVLATDGVLWIRVPDALNHFDSAIGDPTHKRWFAFPRSFIYFEDGHSTHKHYGSHYGFKPWKIDWEKSGLESIFINVYMSPVKV